MSEAAKLTEALLKDMRSHIDYGIAYNGSGAATVLRDWHKAIYSLIDAELLRLRSSLPPDAAGERPARDAMTDWRNGENMAVQNSSAAFAEIVK